MTDSWAIYDEKLERARATSSAAPSMPENARRPEPRACGVYIKMGHLGPASVASSSGHGGSLRDCGFDLAGGLVEVVADRTLFMGGVICDVDTTTERFGLFVAGERPSGMQWRTTGSAATASPTRRCSAASPATSCRAGSRQYRPSHARRKRARGRTSSARSIPSRDNGRLNGAARKTAPTPFGTEAAWSATAPASRGIARSTGLESGLLANRRIRHRSPLQPQPGTDGSICGSACEISRVIALAALKRRIRAARHFRSDFPEAGPICRPSTLRWPGRRARSR